MLICSLTVSVVMNAAPPPEVQIPSSMEPAPPPAADDPPTSEAPPEIAKPPPPAPAKASAPTAAEPPAAPASGESPAGPPASDPTPDTGAEVTVPDLVGLSPPDEAHTAADFVDTRVRRAQPGYHRRRTGFLVGSGVALAASLGMFVAAIIDVREMDQLCGSTALSDVQECDRRLQRVTYLQLGASTTGWASIALAGVGGSYWGRAAAADDWLARSATRNAKVPTIVGGTLVGVGGATTIGSTIALFATCINDGRGCNFKTLQYSLAAFATGTAVAAVGAGILGYGLGYKRAMRNWQRRRGSLSLAPSRSGLSVGLTSRF